MVSKADKERKENLKSFKNVFQVVKLEWKKKHIGCYSISEFVLLMVFLFIERINLVMLVLEIFKN